MKHTFDLLIFDWDGTLMDSTAHIVRAIQRTCADLGLPEASPRAARHVIGLSMHNALACICPDLPVARYPEATAAFQRHFLQDPQTGSLFEGVEDTLQALQARNITLAIATGNSRQGLQRRLEATGLTHYFNSWRTQDDCPSKPHPAMLTELMDEFGAPPERTLMIGDTSHDLRMAQAAGTHAVGLLCGAHQREDLAACEPLALFDDVAELSAWLQTNS